MPKIDDAAYERGRKWCAAGNTLRGLVEAIGSGAAPEVDNEDELMSSGFGFLDELLDNLRGIRR
jgi:hypothetical protein